MDWRQPVPHDAAARRALQLRHGFKQPYGGTTGVLAAMDGGLRPYPMLQLGGYNPAFTNLKPWAEDRPVDTLDDLAALAAKDALRIARMPGTAPRLAEEVIRRTADDLRVLADEGGIAVGPDGAVPRDAAVRLLMRAREAKEAFNLNAFNQFGYYLAPFYTARLYRMLLDVPAGWRAGDRFQLRAIAEAAPQALDLPIYSGVRAFDLDRATMTMKPKRQGLLARLGARARASVTPDRTPAFRAAIHAALREGPAGGLDAAAIAAADLRVAYRFVTAREIVAAFAGP
jgi:hypothetical protein